MPPLETDALIARLIAFRESDRIVWLVTREAGLLSVMVPGARKSQKRFSNLFDLANHVRLSIVKRRRGMGRVESGRLINGFRPLSESATGLAAACHVIEVARRFSVEDQPDPELFDLAAATLGDLAKSGVRQFALRAFEARLLAAAGLAPNVRFCIQCKMEPEENEATHYTVAQSGILCERCGDGRGLATLPAAPRKLLEKILTVGLPELFEIPHERGDLESLSFILPRQIEYHLGGALKALHYARTLPRPADLSKSLSQVETDPEKAGPHADHDSSR